MSVLINGTNGLIQAYDYQVLATGFSYTFAAGTQTLVINPAGTLATGTITMPASPSDGMTITFTTTQQITALTLNGNTGQTVVSGASSMAAGSSATYIYRATGTSWYPLQSVPSVATNTQIGVGQTWQDVKASRANATTYTNTTGKPIFVSVMGSSPTNNGFFLSIGGVTAAETGWYSLAGGQVMGSASGIVPPNATYSVTGWSSTSLFAAWAELR